MKVSTGLLFLAAVIIFLVVVFRQNKKFREMLTYIYEGEGKVKLKAEVSIGEEEYEELYGRFTDWVRKEVDTQEGETTVKFTMNEIRKRNNETFQLDLLNRYLEGLEGGYEEIRTVVDRLVQERGIYRG